VVNVVRLRLCFASPELYWIVGGWRAIAAPIADIADSVIAGAQPVVQSGDEDWINNLDSSPMSDAI